MRRFVAPLIALGLAVVTMGAAAGVSPDPGSTAPGPMAATGTTAVASSTPETTFGPDGVVNVSGLLEGDAVTPTPTATPYQSVAAETGIPGGSATPPPTSAVNGYSRGNDSAPLLLFILLMPGIALAAFEYGRWSLRRRQVD